MAIPTAVKETVLGSNMPESDGEFTSSVNPEQAARIMLQLVDMYPEPARAVLREYIANGVDAVKVSGTSRPVEVTLPTRASATLIIKDYGTGMSLQEIKDHFTSFASSTKTHTNDLLGSIGAGAKSAWSICESFLIDTVKDGKRTVVRASRDLRHLPLVTEQDTDAANGTTIIIPVDMGKNVDWRMTAEVVAQAHPRGVVLIDGEEVATIYDDENRHLGPVLTSDRPYQGTRWGRSAYVLSGGTFFDIPADIRENISRRIGMGAFILQLPIGSFDHTPNRESIIDTPKTAQAVEVALKEFDAEYTKFNAKISKLYKKDILAAFALHIATLGKGSYRSDKYYRRVQMTIPVGTAALMNNSSVEGNRSVEGKPLHIYDGRVPTVLRNVVVVTGSPSGKVNPRWGRVFNALAANPDYPDLTTGSVFVVTDPGDNGMVEIPVTVDGDEVAPVKLGVESKNVVVLPYSVVRDELKRLSSGTPKILSRMYLTTRTGDGDEIVKRMSLGEIVELAASGTRILTTTTTPALPSFVVDGGDTLIVDTEGRSTNPVVGKVGTAKPYADYVATKCAAKMAKVDTNDIAAAWLSWSEQKIAEVCHSAVSRNAMLEPHAAVYAMAELHDRSSKMHKKERDELIALASAGGVGDKHTLFITSTLQELRDAYPLFREFEPTLRWSNHRKNISHVADYLAFTPSVKPE